MSKKDYGKKENRPGPGLSGVVLGVILGFLAGWLINIIYAPFGLALGILSAAIYNDWKSGRK